MPTALDAAKHLIGVRLLQADWSAAGGAAGMAAPSVSRLALESAGKPRGSLTQPRAWNASPLAELRFFLWAGRASQFKALATT